MSEKSAMHAYQPLPTESGLSFVSTLGNPGTRVFRFGVLGATFGLVIMGTALLAGWLGRFWWGFLPLGLAGPLAMLVSIARARVSPIRLFGTTQSIRVSRGRVERTLTFKGTVKVMDDDKGPLFLQVRLISGGETVVVPQATRSEVMAELAGPLGWDVSPDGTAPTTWFLRF